MGFMQNSASGKLVLLLFILTMAVYLVMLLVTIPRVQGFAPGAPLFDLSPAGYSHSEAMILLDSLGPEGRDAYLFPQLALDFIYPGLFAVCYALMLTWLLAKRIRPDSRYFLLALLPVFAGLFDYVENLLIIRMITNFPHVAEGLVTMSSAATLLKSAFSTASFLLLLVGFALLLKKRPKSWPEVGTQSGSTDQADA